MKYAYFIATSVALASLLVVLTIPAQANFVKPIDSLEPVGWLQGGFGDNSRSHTVEPCDFYTNPSLAWHPECPPNTNYILKTNIWDYVNGDVKWYFSDVAIGQNKDFILTYQYQAYTYGAQAVARYTFPGGRHEYELVGQMTQPAAQGMGYEAWVDAVNKFTVPAKATSLTVFFSNSTVPCDNICYGPNYGVLSIANVTLENENVETSTNLIPNPSFETSNNPNNPFGTPKSWFKGGWGQNKRDFFYFAREEDGTKAVAVQITEYKSGDAKWHSKPIPVMAGTYTFSDLYGSNIPSELGVMYETPAGQRYEFVATLPPSPSDVNWATATHQIVVPEDATALTVFHSIYSVGRLNLDEFSLTRD